MRSQRLSEQGGECAQGASRAPGIVSPTNQRACASAGTGLPAGLHRGGRLAADQRGPGDVLVRQSVTVRV